MTIWKSFVFLFILCGVAHVHASDKVTIYAIRAVDPVVWDSPSSLIRSTFINSVSTTYAQNGHLIVGLEHGGHKWLTSMNSSVSLRTAFGVSKNVGLNLLYKDFEGKLDSALYSGQIIDQAAEDGRLASMEIEVSPKIMQELLSFLEKWIRYGAYKHYRGGQIAGYGLGAGCADFVMHFMNRALLGLAPLKSWMREIYLPNDLLEHVFLISIYQREKWAESERDGKHFMIPDPELIYNWIVASAPITQQIKLNPNSLDARDSHFSSQLISKAQFSTHYPEESNSNFRDVWNSIQLY